MFLNKKEKKSHSVITQIFLIIVTFIIMGVSIFLFIGNIENRHLVNNSEEALTAAESKIVSGLLEAETLLISLSESLRSMIIYGMNEEEVSDYLTYLTNVFIADRESIIIINTHAYFFIWNDKFISVKNVNIPDNNNPQNNLCYKAALETDGKIAITISYVGTTHMPLLTFSRSIFDDTGKLIGVVCIDIEMNSLLNIAGTIQLTGNTYGILLNDELEIIMHPQIAFRGQKLSAINSDIAAISYELEKGINIRERKVKNYMRDDSIVYFKKIKHDWYLGIVIPVNEYYKNLNNIVAFLIINCSVLVAVLCIIFYFLFQAKLQSDLRIQQKSNFLATMSHEIRTPLNAILGMTEIQMQDTTHRPSTSEAFIKINNSGNLLLNIINDILDLSKIESGNLDLVPVKYDVANLINDIVQLNYIRYEGKSIDFILELDENIPSTLIGDDLRIKQILNNILSNAFKYTERGSVIFSANAECISRGGFVNVTLVFQVSDTGYGMTSEQISKIFDENTGINMEANRVTEGAGLGLTITKNLVDLMYGKIAVKSTLGEGTTVTIRIPQKTDGVGISGVFGKEMVDSLCKFRHNGSLQLKKLQFTYEYMPYGKVLIVDDVETNIFVAKGLMVPYGLEIDLALSGFDAIEKIKQGEVYDIIFMDHMMPKMDGIETTKRLRNMGYTNPIVALTANALAGQADVFLQNGFDAFLSKPIDIRNLNVILNKMIRDKQTSEVIEAAHKEKRRIDKNNIGIKPIQVDSQLASIFSRDAEKAVQIIEESFEKKLKTEEDMQAFIIHVHSMKSALANIGEKDLSATALRLEQAGRDNNINVILSETQAFIEDLHKVIDKYKTKNNNTGEDTEENLAILKEQFIIIKNACESFDKKTAKAALNKLLEINWSEKTKNILNSIAENLLHSEFDSIVELVNENLK